MDEELALLRSYVADGSERSFTKLVERSVPLVFGSALRRMRGDNHAAAEFGLRGDRISNVVGNTLSTTL